MHVVSLSVLVDGRPCGQLMHEPATQRWAFTYLPEWTEHETAFALSPFLPLQTHDRQTPEQHSAAVRIFFENLLPEGRALDDAAATFKVSKANSFGLLSALGGETAGALALHAVDRPDRAGAASRARHVSRADLSERIRQRPYMPFTVWDGRIRLSIAGYQDKLAVLEDRGEWYLVEGSTLASTHLLKPEPLDARLTGLTTNERLCMALAQAVGIATAPTRLVHVPEPVLLIERFDRRREESRVARLHCIDGCQALGLPVGLKYERPYGNAEHVQGIRDGANLPALFAQLTAHAATPAVEQVALLRWVILQTLIGNVDGHAKNISFLVSSEGLRVAPAYDLVCGLIYESEGMEAMLAMAIGDEFEPRALRTFDWAELAVRCALPPRLVARELARLARACVAQLPAAAAAVLEEGGHRDTLDKVGHVVRTQAQVALQAAPGIERMVREELTMPDS